MPKETSKDKGALRVVELFAGVGGFRLGLCGSNDRSKDFRVVWANQWEPGTNKQHAAQVYSARFHDGKEPNPSFNENIFMAKEVVPPHDLLVGGFPCQDYSVARTLSHAAGIDGKKGVLWWAIRDIAEKQRPPYLMLENVDRLLKSPAKQRGRDFGIMLASLADLGYIVEWRIVNAADYGMPQRRRRIFILAYHKTSPIGRLAAKCDPLAWITEQGVIAKAFPAASKDTHLPTSQIIEGDLAAVSESFAQPLENAGFMSARKFFTQKMVHRYDGPKQTLADIVLSPTEVPQEYFIGKKDLAAWKYLKSGKKEERTTKDGFRYFYSEGPVGFPDQLDKPSRTIVTGEGGSSPSRFKHVIKQGSRYRRLMPLELERLCMFPDRHTEAEGISDQRRAFFMGNALVVGVIEKLGRALATAHRQVQPEPKRLIR